VAYLRAMSRRPGFLASLAAGLLFATAAARNEPVVRTALIAVGVVVVLVIVGFVVWRVGTEDGVPRP
jgi:hypothetical protein